MPWKQITGFLRVLINFTSEIPDASSSLPLPSFSYSLVSVFQADLVYKEGWIQVTASHQDRSLRWPIFTKLIRNTDLESPDLAQQVQKSSTKGRSHNLSPSLVSQANNPKERSCSSMFCLLKIDVNKDHLPFLVTQKLHCHFPSFQPKECKTLPVWEDAKAISFPKDLGLAVCAHNSPWRQYHLLQPPS